MCRRVQCGTCGKPTFAGCGQHVESVLANVPKADRCQGHDQRAAKTADVAGAPAPGFFERLFKR